MTIGPIPEAGNDIATPDTPGTEPEGGDGSILTEQERKQFVQNVLGQDNKNALDRIVVECAAFIDAMIKQLPKNVDTH